MLKNRQSKYGHNIYVIMKTICPTTYHHNDFVGTHKLGQLMYEQAEQGCFLLIYTYEMLPLILTLTLIIKKL